MLTIGEGRLQGLDEGGFEDSIAMRMDGTGAMSSGYLVGKEERFTARYSA